MFFLFYILVIDRVFDDFQKISEHFPNVSEDCPKLIGRSKNKQVHYILSTRAYQRYKDIPRMWFHMDFMSEVFSSKTLVSI